MSTGKDPKVADTLTPTTDENGNFYVDDRGWFIFADAQGSIIAVHPDHVIIENGIPRLRKEEEQPPVA